MKIHNEEMNVRILALAVQCALLATFALPLGAHAAEEDDADALKHPSNSVNFGALYASQSSAKFGEYNGLNDQGFYGLGGFDVRGGKGYDAKHSALRWKLGGANLGTTSRTLDGSVSDQGKWKLNLGYDELRHNITDTFQTPQQGKMGSNHFTFPANFGAFNGQADPSARVLTPSQLDAFHTEKEYTTRRNGSLGASYTLTDQLNARIDYNHLDQSGAKLIGSSALGGVAATTGSWRSEAINILMNPTNYSTDNINAALNWVGDKGHLTGGYYGSIFRDGYNSLTWQNAMLSNASTAAAGLYQTNTMSTAPDNSLHQLNLTGGYAFSPTTKLAGGGSYSHNTQDNGFLSGQPEIVLAPRSSLNGKVETTHGDLKLTNQTTKDLVLSAGLKYNERNNRSPSDLYQFYAINNVTAVDAAANAPYSNRKVQVELAGDYRLSKGQNVRLAYEHEYIKRWCDYYAISGGANCLVNPSNDEDKVGLTYRLKAFEDVSFNAGYTYAKRRADFEGNAITPLAGLDTRTPDDVNALNYPGFIAYPYAKRDQNLVKAGVNWQATKKLDLGLNGRYAHDDYAVTLGVQDGHSAGVNVDATYSYTENLSVSAYASWQNSERNIKSACNHTIVGVEYCHIIGGNNTGRFEATSYDALVAPANNWTNQLKDDSNAIGINARHKGLMGGKLEIIGDLSYSLDTSKYSTKVPYDPACGTSAKLTCGDTPDIKNELISIKLTGNYKVHKNGKVALAYIYQKLNSNDYFYNGQQFGFTPNRVMPTGLREQDYTVNVVALSYRYNF